MVFSLFSSVGFGDIGVELESGGGLAQLSMILAAADES
jgi:hypothetical protein